MAAAGFLSCYLSGPLPCLTPYNRKYNVLSASLNKIFPSFLPIYTDVTYYLFILLIITMINHLLLHFMANVLFPFVC